SLLHAQVGGCVLVPEGLTPAENILRCGPGLTIRVAPNTVYRLTAPRGSQQPTGARPESRALLIEIERGAAGRKFQIQRPPAIGARRDAIARSRRRMRSRRCAAPPGRSKSRPPRPTPSW